MIKKVIKFVINFFTVLIFLILLLTIYAKINMITSGKNYFELFGYSFFKVTTGSMDPTIKEHDIIIVSTNETYNVNDIITYRDDANFITHRIITMDGNTLITKGDANNATDQEVNKSDVIGKVVKIFSGLGIWQSIFTTPKVIVALFVTLILFDFAFSYKGKENKNKKVEKEKNEEIKNFDKNKKSEENNETIEEDYTIRLDLNAIRKKIDSNIENEDK